MSDQPLLPWLLPVHAGLTGLNKAETADKYGEDQVKIWRRSYDVPPLPMDEDHAYAPLPPTLLLLLPVPALCARRS